MAAVLRRLATLTLGLALLTGCSDDEDPAPAESPEGDPVSIALYAADFSVSAAGDLSVVETLTLDVPVDDRHGIFRAFEADTSVEEFAATLDGGETPVVESVEGDEQVFKIGDPDQTLSVGEHVVRIEYGVADVLTRDPAAGRARQFHWQLVPGEWEMDIDATDLTVRLPAAVSSAECVIGDDEPCEVSGVGTTTLVITTEALDEHTPIELHALLTGL